MLRQKLLLYALLAAAVVPYFLDLGGSSIWDANEAFYVQTPREMLERGDWISPTFNFQPRLNKPVLSYWIVGGFYEVFGVSVAVQRVPIALGGLVLILSAFVLAHAGAREGRARDSALWAAIGLAIAPRLLMFARRIMIDIYISMFMALALLFFALSERYPARRRTFLLLMYVAVGLGVLTKGPIAAVLPGLTFAIYLVVHRELKRVREMMLPAGVALVLAIVVPWYAVLYFRHGWSVIVSFFLGENVARYTEGVGVDAVRGPFFYLPVVFTDAFPWSLFLFGAAAVWISNTRRRDLPAEGVPGGLAARVRTLAWIWILTIVVFFSLSAAKQDLYIFPIVPAIAALAGLFVVEAFDAAHGRWRAIFRMTIGLVALVFIVGGAATLYTFSVAGHVYPIAGATLVGVLALVGGVCALAAAFRHERIALTSVALTMIALNWVFVLRVLPSFERYKPVPALTAAIESRLAPGDLVVHYNVALPSMVYYLNRPIAITFDATDFTGMLRSDRTVYAVLQDTDHAALEPQFGVRTCVLARAPNLNVKLREVVARQQPPEVLVITNRCAD